MLECYSSGIRFLSSQIRREKSLTTVILTVADIPDVIDVQLALDYLFSKIRRARSKIPRGTSHFGECDVRSYFEITGRMRRVEGGNRRTLPQTTVVLVRFMLPYLNNS